MRLGGFSRVGWEGGRMSEREGEGDGPVYSGIRSLVMAAPTEGSLPQRMMGRGAI